MDPTWEFFRSKPSYNTPFNELFEIKKNQVRMMLDRKYVVSDSERKILDYDIKQFEQYFRSLPGKGHSKLSSSYIDNNGNKLMVLYISKIYIENNPKITSGEIESYIKYIRGGNIKHYILVLQYPVDTSAEKDILELQSFDIEIFTFDELVYNPVDHFLVPHHEVLSEEEKNKLLMNNRLNINDLLYISYKDPIVKYYGAKVGQVIRIYRVSLIPETVIDKYITYRVVMPIEMYKSKAKRSK